MEFFITSHEVTFRGWIEDLTAKSENVTAPGFYRLFRLFKIWIYGTSKKKVETGETEYIETWYPDPVQHYAKA